jgi:hypothetical protein
MPDQGYFDMQGYSRLDGELVDVKYEVHFKIIGLIGNKKEYDHLEIITSINNIAAKHFTQETINEVNNNIEDDIMSQIYERRSK